MVANPKRAIREQREAKDEYDESVFRLVPADSGDLLGYR